MNEQQTDIHINSAANFIADALKEPEPPKPIEVYGILNYTPGKRNVWLDTSVGRIRKPVESKMVQDFLANPKVDLS